MSAATAFLLSSIVNIASPMPDQASALSAAIDEISAARSSSHVNLSVEKGAALSPSLNSALRRRASQLGAAMAVLNARFAAAGSLLASVSSSVGGDTTFFAIPVSFTGDGRGFQFTMLATDRDLRSVSVASEFCNLYLDLLKVSLGYFGNSGGGDVAAALIVSVHGLEAPASLADVPAQAGFIENASNLTVRFSYNNSQSSLSCSNRLTGPRPR